MIQLISDYCCGCGACVDACPINILHLVSDHEGFYKPEIQGDCIHCGRCLNSCPVHFPPEGSLPLGFYACTAQLDETEKSSSGAVFPALASSFLENGGYVYGCAWNEEGLAEHIEISSVKGLDRLRRSKYVQSHSNGIFKKIKERLISGEKVLFSGTPCQVAGLKTYLGREYNSLTTVDFICHGVPSPKVYKMYIKHLEEKNGTKVETINFRDKSEGWNVLRLTVQFADGKIYSHPASTDSYYRAFLGNLSLNKICGECFFNTLPRVADITLGDFWGVENYHANFPKNCGVSCVTVSTPKGEKLFNTVADKLTVEMTAKESILKGNPFLDGHCTLHRRREEFFSELGNEDFDALVEKYLKPTLWERTGEVVRYKMRKLRTIFHP